MNIHSENFTPTASSGSFSVNTQNLRGILREILAKPTTATTNFDIKITNNQSVDIYERKGESCLLAEEVALPLQGIYTIAVDNSTVDEQFTLQLVMQE